MPEIPTFDPLLPDAACFDPYIVGTDRVVKSDYEAGFNCHRCGTHTQWVSVGFSEPFCSPACLYRFWSEWWLADIDDVPINEKKCNKETEDLGKKVRIHNLAGLD